jgi:hypothetical protein
MEEWKLKQMDEELRHEQAMRKLQSERLDSHDASFDHCITAFDRIRASLEEIVQVQKQFAVDHAIFAEEQAKTDSMLRDLIAALTNTGGNGKH